MQQSTKKSYESEGFRAHIFLEEKRGQTRWAYVAASKLTTALTEEDTAWKESKTARYKAYSTTRQLTFNYDIAQRFQRLADQWHNETGHYSLMFKRAMHPAYQQIIGMGKDAIPLILNDLRVRPTGHWFWALGAITGEDPTLGQADIDKAIQAWLKWRAQS